MASLETLLMIPTSIIHRQNFESEVSFRFNNSDRVRFCRQIVLQLCKKAEVAKKTFFQTIKNLKRAFLEEKKLQRIFGTKRKKNLGLPLLTGQRSWHTEQIVILAGNG